MQGNNKNLGNLVLNRRPGLSIQIGDDIVITYLGQDHNDAARIRVTAPKHLDISRIKCEEHQISKQ